VDRKKTFNEACMLSNKNHKSTNRQYQTKSRRCLVSKHNISSLLIFFQCALSSEHNAENASMVAVTAAAAAAAAAHIAADCPDAVYLLKKVGV
jgi:hypothetical protein